MTKETGTAYAFFDCDAPKAQLEADIPEMRDGSVASNGLVMKLFEGISSMQLDESLSTALAFPDDYRVFRSGQRELAAAREEVPLSSMRYAIEAKCEGADNKITADKLADVVNYIDKKFNARDKYFRGAVAYESNGEYTLRE